MTDAFKKRSTGDPSRVPAEAHNAFIDAALAQKRNMALGMGGGRGMAVSGTVITVYNPTATDITWPSAVEILSTEQGEDVTVGKPGEAAGTGVYGISLEPIPGSAYGAVALAGGPWKLTVAESVTPGGQVGPVDDAWTASTSGPATWEVLRKEDDDDVALVRFLAVGAIGAGGALEFFCDGGGAAIAANTKIRIEVPFNCDIERHTFLADQAGSIVMDIWKDTYANYPPTNADSICGGNEPTITASDKAQDSTLTDWTTALSKGDILICNVDSCSTITQFLLSLIIG